MTTSTSWMDEGTCSGGQVPTSVFFPTGSSMKVRIAYEAARAICFKCPVIGECREYAITNRINDGMWGGTTLAERRKIIKERRNATG